MGSPQLRSGVGAELVGQQPAEVLIGAQRLRRPTVGLQRSDKQDAQPLPQGMHGHELLQLGNEVGGLRRDLEVGLHAVLGRGEPQLLEPDGGCRRERDVRDVGERLAPPQAERLP
jgi:hypothetical protein